MDTKIQIQKLNNQNYSVWSYKLKLLLIKEKVWDNITANTPDPVTATWTSNDQNAQALIGLNVEDTQLLHIRNKTTAREIWTTLKEIHEHDSVTNIVTLIRKMYATMI